MKDICCIGHVTKDKIVTPHRTVYMAGGTSFYFAYAINQLPKDVSFSLVTAMDPTETEPIEKMRQAGIDVTLNPSRNTVFFENIYEEDQKVYPIDWKEKLEVLKNTYYLKVNETEMETITGLKEPREAAKLIHSWGVTEVIVTLGSEGSLIYVDDTFYEIPAYPPHEVVDATGCGDTYSAGYLYKRLQGATPTEAGKFAAAMCTIKLEHNGPFNRSIEDVEQIIK